MHHCGQMTHISSCLVQTGLLWRLSMFRPVIAARATLQYRLSSVTLSRVRNCAPAMAPAVPARRAITSLPSCFRRLQGHDSQCTGGEVTAASKVAAAAWQQVQQVQQQRENMQDQQMLAVTTCRRCSCTTLSRDARSSSVRALRHVTRCPCMYVALQCTTTAILVSSGVRLSLACSTSRLVQIPPPPLLSP